ncbi:MAG: Bifunctional hemolysin/adenylate cyclase precursor, partial [Pseudomonadota bacterium]
MVFFFIFSLTSKVWAAPYYLYLDISGANTTIDDTPHITSWRLSVLQNYDFGGGVFELKRGSSTPTDDIRLKIYNGNDTSGTLIGEVVVSKNTVSGTFNPISFIFPTPLTLTPGSYYITLSSNTSSAGNVQYFVKGADSATLNLTGPGAALDAAYGTVSSNPTTTSNFTLSKSAPASVQINQNLTYSFGLGNSGANLSGTSARISEDLPAGVVATAVTAGTGVSGVNCGSLPSAEGALLSCSVTLSAGLASSAPNGTAAFTLSTTAPASAGTIVNYASVDPTGGIAPATPGSGCITPSCASASTIVNSTSDVTAPIITGPSGGAGAAASAITVDENQTGVTTLTANETVTWSLVGGTDQAKFSISAGGVITFQSAPDYETPTDSDTNNTYVVQVRATDTAGNISTQTVTVTVANLDEVAPIITGPSGGAGAAASAITVDENQTGVTTLTANETVTWSLVGGTDQAKFSISAGGVITFQSAPDYETPTDSDTNNTYVVQVRATDTAGNISTQTVTVTVLDISDTAPIISGATTLTVDENQTGVTTLLANRAVSWSIVGGSDQGSFAINASGVVAFQSAPDYETPTDSNVNNSYIVLVRATDSSGNVATTTVTVLIRNLEDSPPIAGGGTASISGRITRSSGPPIAGVLVELVDGTGLVIATAVSQGGGFYAFSNIPEGNYGVQFNTSSGISRSHTDVGTPHGNAVTNISVTSGTDIKDVDAIVLDPSGVIYDSIQRTPVAGAQVSFYFGGNKVSNSWLDTALGGLNDQTTDSTGFYSFVLNGSASSGTYELRVTAPSGYSNAASILIPSGGTLTTALGGGVQEVQPQATAPVAGQSTLYYTQFTFTVGATMATTSDGVVKNHIPLDPMMTAALSVTQNATEAGQPARYTVALNRTNATGSGLTFDIKDLATGTASGGTDYPALLVNQQLVVPSGSSSGTFELMAADDAVVDPDETVSLQISNPSVGGVNIAPFTTLTTDLGTASIADNDNAPVFTGTNTTFDGKPAFSIDYPENQLAGAILGTAAATDADGNSLTYSISAGDPGGSTPWFVINSSGEVSLTTEGVASVANDFEQLANGQTLTLTASDGANPTSIVMVLNETDADDIPPLISVAGNPVGPSSAITVNENQTGVTTLTANEAVTWSLVGGSDQGKFVISAEGVLTFLPAPDFELPKDVDANNIYLVQVQAKDAAGNVSQLAVSVTVADVDDAAPLITGPSGGPGAGVSAITVKENQTAVLTLTADETATWSLSGGTDRARFKIDAVTGELTFLVA